MKLKLHGFVKMLIWFDFIKKGEADINISINFTGHTIHAHVFFRIIVFWIKVPVIIVPAKL